MLTVRDRVLRLRLAAFASQYVRDVLWGSVWAAINFVLAVASVVLILDPHPPVLPAGLTPARGLVVKKNAVCGKNTISFPVNPGDPIPVKL